MNNKNDNRWWHIEEYLTGKKALHIGKRIRFNWYINESTKFDIKAFKSIDMYYAHIVLFYKVLEFHYYRRGV